MNYHYSEFRGKGLGKTAFFIGAGLVIGKYVGERIVLAIKFVDSAISERIQESETYKKFCDKNDILHQDSKNNEDTVVDIGFHM